jgi:hypothetical protein
VNIKASILFLLIFVLVMPAFSGKEYKIHPAPADDIVLKSADHKAVEAYRNNIDFNYKEKPVHERYNFLPKWLMNYLAKFLETIFRSAALEIVFILLITSIALYILLRLNGIDPAGLLKRNPHELKNAVYSQVLEQQLIQYDILIDEAVRAGDFRFAIRLHFLDILMKLDKKGIISFKEDKTNREYYNEINQPSVKKGFSGVAGIFENVWYGELVLSKNQYTKLESVISGLGKGMGL